MISSSLIAVTPPIQLTVPVCNDSPAEGSVLGQILFLEWKHVQILICAAMMRGLLTEEVAAQRDFLAELHQLSEFPRYESAPTSRHDEPLFARGTWKPVVNHKTFGVGTLLKIREDLKGLPLFDVLFVDGTRTVNVFWLTGHEKPLRKWWLRKREFKFPDSSPTKMDKVVEHVGGRCGHDREGRSCPRWSKRPDFHQVTSKDVASGQWKSVAGIAASESANIRNGDVAKRLNFCPRCWVARVQRVPLKTACMDCKGLAQFDAAEAKRSTKQAKTLEDYCATWKAEYDRKRLQARRLRERFVYSSDEFDRDILVSRECDG